MPLIHYAHPEAECLYAATKFYRSPKEAPSTFFCPKCGKDMKKMLKAPASTSTLIVDNGVQARATEVNLEVIEDIKARSTKDFKNE